jgi:hypothetical protein
VTEILGRASPREVPEVLAGNEVVTVDELIPSSDVPCLLLIAAVGDDELADRVEIKAEVGSAPAISAPRELDDMPIIAVDEGTAFGTEDGIATGQNDHSLLPWSQ